MDQNMTQRVTSWDDDTSPVNSNAPAVPPQSALVDPPPTFHVRKSVWPFRSKRIISPVNPALELVEGGQSTMKLMDRTLSAKKTNFFRRATSKNCLSPCKTFFRGLTIGVLLAGIALAAVLTIWLRTRGIQGTSTTNFSSISTASISTLTTTSTSSTTATTVSTSTSSTTTSTTTTTTVSTSTSSSSTSTTTTTTTTVSTSTSSSSTSTTTSRTTTSSTSTSSTTTTTTMTTTAWTCMSILSSLATATTLLNLTNVPSQSYTQYSYTYVALTTSTCLTLSFRMDSKNWSLDTLSVISVGTSTELLTNGDFESGDMTGWSSCNPNNATNYGFVQNNYIYTQAGFNYWKDGSTGAADYLYQYFPSLVGTNYTISFWLRGDGKLPNTANVYIGS